jgi:hypothetical protein
MALDKYLVFTYNGHSGVLNGGTNAVNTSSGCEVYDAGEEVRVYDKR